MSMSASSQAIFRLLSQKADRHRLGQFTGTGVVDVQQSKTPRVDVNGFGTIGSPLSPQQAAALITQMQQAPFGKGFETIVDTDVRRAWQLGADRVTLNPRWTREALPAIVSEACEQLGLDAVAMGVQARLYKLMCYEAGGHFKTHRDTEKEPGMFATLIVQLPSEHKGGDLVVQHRGEQMRFDFATGSGEATRYAAFYADCEHTLEPVTEGVRLVLAYNLVRTKADQGLYPQAGEQQAGRAQLTDAVKRWVVEVEADKKLQSKKSYSRRKLAPEKLVYLLGHKYSKTSLSFDGLKGGDRTLVRALRGLRNDMGGREKVAEATGGGGGSSTPTDIMIGGTATPAAGGSSEEPLLDVYLCLIERHFTDPDTKDERCEHEENVSFPLWIGEKGTVLPFPKLHIAFSSEILGKRRPYGEQRRKMGVEVNPNEQLDTTTGKKTRKCHDDDDEEDGDGDDDDDDDDDGDDDDDDDSYDDRPQRFCEWDDKPHKEEQVGYTGNDGYSADSWYYTAAIVFWPRSEAFRMVSKAGSFLRLAELAEDAAARGAPYADKYLSDLVNLLLGKAAKYSNRRENELLPFFHHYRSEAEEEAEEEEDEDAEEEEAEEEEEEAEQEEEAEEEEEEEAEEEEKEKAMKTVLSTIFRIVPSADLLARTVQVACIARKVSFDDILIADITEAIVRLLSLPSDSSTSISAAAAVTATTATTATTTAALGDKVISSGSSSASAVDSVSYPHAGLDAVIDHLLSAGNTRSAVDLVLSIKAEIARKQEGAATAATATAAATAAATTATGTAAATTATGTGTALAPAIAIASLLSVIVGHLVQLISAHIDEKCKSEGTGFLLGLANNRGHRHRGHRHRGHRHRGHRHQSSPPPLLPSLATFEAFLPFLERVVDDINSSSSSSEGSNDSRQQQQQQLLTFSQYVAIAEAVLAAPTVPPILAQGHKAIAAILSHSPAALAREEEGSSADSDSRSKVVVWMYWALLQLSQLSATSCTTATAVSGASTDAAATFTDDYRHVLESLAEAIKAHPQCEALLKPLLANTDVQEAVRRGDGISRSLFEYRVQQLLASESVIVPGSDVSNELKTLQQLLLLH